MKFINIGLNYYVNVDFIACIIPSTASAVRTIVKRADERNQLHDYTAGKRRRSVIVLTNGLIILSWTITDTLLKRLYKAKNSTN